MSVAATPVGIVGALGGVGGGRGVRGADIWRLQAAAASCLCNFEAGLTGRQNISGVWWLPPGTQLN